MFPLPSKLRDRPDAFFSYKKIIEKNLECLVKEASLKILIQELAPKQLPLKSARDNGLNRLSANEIIELSSFLKTIKIPSDFFTVNRTSIEDEIYQLSKDSVLDKK